MYFMKFALASTVAFSIGWFIGAYFYIESEPSADSVLNEEIYICRIL